MSNATYSLTGTQKAGVGLLSVLIVLVWFGLFKVCRRVVDGCQAVTALVCSVLCIVLAAAIVGIIAITENPGSLTWIEEHV